MAFVGVLPYAVALGGCSPTSRLYAGKLHPSKRGRAPTVRARNGVWASACRERRTENVVGDVFVDTSCIDCDTCRWLAPDTFERVGGQSAVYQQPGKMELNLAMAAIAACPTGSIHSEENKKAKLNGSEQFPMPVSKLMKDTGGDAAEELGDVYYMGMTAEQTFAASSWVLYLRDVDIAIMVDVPRYSNSFANRVRKFFNGSTTKWIMVLTHRDDVYNHDKWAKALDAPRYIHQMESNSRQGTDKCEVQLNSEDLPYTLVPGVELLFVPGHSMGHIVVLHKASKTLFSGDHLFGKSNGSLTPSPAFTWGSWDELKRSMQKTMEIPFLHVFPGHGRHIHFENDEHRRRALRQVVEEM